MRRHAILGLIYAIAWIAAAAFVELAMSSSSSRHAYAAINAWWLTVYLALALRATWKDALAFFVWMAVAMTVSVACGIDVLYHDAPSVSSPSFLGLLLLMGGFWFSPFLVNAIVRLLMHAIERTPIRR
jgi:hypothetical protein